MLPGNAREVWYVDKHARAHTTVECGLQIAVKLARADMQWPAKPHTATYSVTLSNHELFDRSVQNEGFITLLLVKKGLNQESL